MNKFRGSSCTSALELGNVVRDRRPRSHVVVLFGFLPFRLVTDGAGFKCQHVDNIDYETHCKTLESCLGVLKTWSDNNPGHIPLILRLELKLETMIETLERADQEAAAFVNEELQQAAQV